MQILGQLFEPLYFRQPQALNRHQAQWLIDLADFNLKMIHVPRKLLARPDALSCHPNLLPTDDNDNTGVTLLPSSLFVNLIDTALSQHIESAFASNPATEVSAILSYHISEKETPRPLLILLSVVMTLSVSEV